MHSKIQKYLIQLVPICYTWCTACLRVRGHMWLYSTLLRPEQAHLCCQSTSTMFQLHNLHSIIFQCTAATLCNFTAPSPAAAGASPMGVQQRKGKSSQRRDQNKVKFRPDLQLLCANWKGRDCRTLSTDAIHMYINARDIHEYIWEASINCQLPLQKQIKLIVQQMRAGMIKSHTWVCKCRLICIGDV